MRRGFTLIEMILVLFIMGIIGGASVVSVRYYNTIKNKVDADYSCNAIVSFINNSKMYCRENSCIGIITFDVPRNEIKLVRDSIMVSKQILSNKITMEKVIWNDENKGFLIEKDGYSDTSGSIYLKDNNLNEYKITVRVASKFIEIKMKVGSNYVSVK